MKFRKIIFWSHLVAGVTAGLIILILSATGVILMYERQILRLVEPHFSANPNKEMSYLTADELTAFAQEAKGPGISLQLQNDSNAPVTIRHGRRQQTMMNPHTGELSASGETAVGEFFHTVTGFHRWFAMEGENRDTARGIIGAANLIFLFIIISGIYLWLPKVWKWFFIRKSLLFIRHPVTTKARDYNWHHVLGFWALIPLLPIVVTGSVFYYPWSADLIYAAFGTEYPKNRSAPDGPGFEVQVDPGKMLTLEQTLAIAKAYDPDWQRIDMQPDSAVVVFSVDTGTGGEPTKKTQIFVSRADGEILKTAPFSDRPLNNRLRSHIRFLHTGESLGLIGQTIFGLASLAACFLVYTGLALAFRRLLMPYFRKPLKT